MELSLVTAPASLPACHGLPLQARSALTERKAAILGAQKLRPQAHLSESMSKPYRKSRQEGVRGEGGESLLVRKVRVRMLFCDSGHAFTTPMYLRNLRARQAL